MRIDKFLTSCGKCSRTEASKLAKRGEITVNGKTVKDASLHIDPEKDVITLSGEALNYQKFVYIMLNKPEGYVCATEDAGPTVVELLSPELQKMGLFPCGRLDKYTLGFVLLTNNGPLAHALLSPKHHAEKKYRFSLMNPLCEDERITLEKGVSISTPRGAYSTKPCTIKMESDKSGVITLTEGKYHQIKKMAEAVKNKIVFLERISFAGIDLDDKLSRGEYRYLNESEQAMLESHSV